MKIRTHNGRLWQKLIGACIAATLICSPEIVVAQATGKPSSADVLEEIIVTAHKREESAQRVTASMQVITGDTLQRQNTNSLTELSETVPGLHVSGSGEFSNDMYIRGIGSGNNPSFDQSVATFVDDIFHGRSRSTEATFLDIERVEVLKGPQSTFFGNNAIAGALNIVTRKPGDKYEGYARASYGTFGQYSTEAGVTVPVDSVLSFRLAGIADGQRGWISNVDSGERSPNDRNLAGRITAAFRPSSDFEALLSVQHTHEETRGTPFGAPLQWVNCPPPAFLDPSTCAPALAAGVPIGLDNNRNAGLAGQSNDLLTTDTTLTINYKVGGGFTLTSVTGYEWYRFNANLDLNNLPDYQVTAVVPEKYHQVSQELRITSPSDRPLTFLAGAYFQQDKLVWAAEANLPAVNFLATLPPFASLAPYLPLAVNNSFEQPETIYSLFGAVDWNIGDRLTLSAGLRGSRVKKSFTGDSQVGTGTQTFGGFVAAPASVAPLISAVLGAAGQQNLRRSDSDWMPSVGARYRFNPDAMVYFTYTKGFKAGGFNGVTPLAPPGNIDFDPENVNAYEIGFKSEWLDHRLLLNVAAFRSEYDNLQVNAVVCPINPATGLSQCGNEVRNAASSVSQGLELETRVAVTPAFHVSAFVTYLDSHFAKYANAPPTTLQRSCTTNYALPECSIYPNPVPATADLSGQSTPFSPRWSGSIVADYTTHLTADLDLTAEVSPYASSRYNNMDPYLLGTDSYVRLDGRLTLAKSNGRWALDLIGKNLTDEIISIPGGPSGTNFASKEQPRTVALQLRARW